MTKKKGVRKLAPFYFPFKGEFNMPKKIIITDEMLEKKFFEIQIDSLFSETICPAFYEDIAEEDRTSAIIYFRKVAATYHFE